MKMVSTGVGLLFDSFNKKAYDFSFFFLKSKKLEASSGSHFFGNCRCLSYELSKFSNSSKKLSFQFFQRTNGFHENTGEELKIV